MNGHNNSTYMATKQRKSHAPRRSSTMPLDESMLQYAPQPLSSFPY